MTENDKVLKLLLEKQKAIEKELNSSSKALSLQSGLLRKIDDSFLKIDSTMSKIGSKSSFIYAENKILRQLIKMIWMTIDHCDQSDYEDVRYTIRKIEDILKDAASSNTIDHNDGNNILRNGGQSSDGGMVFDSTI